MTLTWTPELDTGIDVIDQQHRQLMNYVNGLEGATKRNDRRSVGLVLDQLVEYTLSHFAFEETLQVEAGYKFAAAHKAVHKVFTDRVVKYRDRWKSGEDISRELTTMLRTWLVQHIQREDRAYVKEVNARLMKIVEDKKPDGWVSRTLTRFFK